MRSGLIFISHKDILSVFLPNRTLPQILHVQGKILVRILENLLLLFIPLAKTYFYNSNNPGRIELSWYSLFDIGLNIFLYLF